MFVAGFIGSPAMNFIDARLHDGGRKAELSGGQVIELGDRLKGHADVSVTIGVRPEHFQVAEDSLGALPHKVAVIEQLGADTLVHGQLGSGEGDVTVRLSGVRRIDTGTILPVKVDPDLVHLFDANSVMRLG